MKLALCYKKFELSQLCCIGSSIGGEFLGGGNPFTGLRIYICSLFLTLHVELRWLSSDG